MAKPRRNRVDRHKLLFNKVKRMHSISRLVGCGVERGIERVLCTIIIIIIMNGRHIDNTETILNSFSK